MIQPTTQQAYPQSGGANAVAINIYNPQAYGSGTVPSTYSGQAPYQYTNSLYSMPQTSAWVQPNNLDLQNQQTMPSQNPVIYQPQASQNAFIPAPQMMPQSVLETPQQITEPMVEPQTLEQQQQPEAQEQIQDTPQVEIEQPQEQYPTVDVDGLVNELKSNDADIKADAINKIAAYTQESPEIALQVVSEPILYALSDIIKEDTSALEGPSDEQIAVAEKITNNETLTPEEEALAEQLSPRDKANKNRIFALYTLAMIEKLQRDNLNEYIEAAKQNGEEPLVEPLKINDLIGYNDVKDVIQNDSRPEVKVAAIQALAHMAELDDEAEVKEVLKDSLNSSDESIKAAAEEAISKFTVPDAA